LALTKIQDTDLHNVMHLYIKMHIAFDSDKHNFFTKDKKHFKQNSLEQYHFKIPSSNIQLA